MQLQIQIINAMNRKITAHTEISEAANQILGHHSHMNKTY